MKAITLPPLTDLQTEEAIVETLEMCLAWLEEYIQSLPPGSRAQRAEMAKEMRVIRYIENLQIHWMEVCDANCRS